MSHEIRTPLNSILLASENLQATSLNDEQKELAEVIESSNNSIQVLIKDILDFTKGQSGKESIEVAPFNLRKLTQQIIEENQHSNSNSRVSLTLHYELKQDLFSGAQVKVGQIITNLISNSMKFTTDGEVKLLLQKNTKNDQIIIKVQDTGVGIEESRLEAIFDEFEQEDNSTTRIFGGTGLGLAIVKQVVHQLNGSLNVESKKDQGSTFTIEIPLQVAKKTPAQEKRTANNNNLSPNLSKMRVLVFEDNQTNANLMIKRISKMGVAHVDTALNGRDGIELMKKACFDLIIMDIQMPILNGIEATKIIRSSVLGENSPQIPIIGLSANSFQEDVEFALEAGMDDYLSKPAKKEELKAAIIRFSK
jgi:CheY-like chemotaxis protein